MMAPLPAATDQCKDTEGNEHVGLKVLFQRLKEAWREHAEEVQDERSAVDVTSLQPSKSAPLAGSVPPRAALRQELGAKNTMLRQDTGMEEAQQAW